MTSATREPELAALSACEAMEVTGGTALMPGRLRPRWFGALLRDLGKPIRFRAAPDPDGDPARVFGRRF